MNTQPDRQRVVVGYDGSPEARVAVDWAADEAGRTGCRLHIVHAYRLGWPASYFDRPAAPAAEEARRYADRLVAKAVATVLASHPGIEVTGAPVHDAPAPTLIRIGAPDTRLIVVGNRGAGGLTGLVLGSVSLHVATHASTPVAVVRGRVHATGPVVVGTDGSPAADTALETAFAAAAARNAPLLAIRALAPPADTGSRLESLEAAERAALDSSLRVWRDKYPEVAVTPSLDVGSAARVLVNRSHTAQLVVVGSRGHGSFTGLLLGSTGQQLMHHAGCPIVIAHAPAAG